MIIDNKDLSNFDKWIIGDSWVNSNIEDLADKLCIEIGDRWASSNNERNAANYIYDYWASNKLLPHHEEFEIDTWNFKKYSLKVGKNNFDLKPYHRCPSTNLQAKLIDVGYGTFREISDLNNDLKGTIALMLRKNEPFTDPEPIFRRILNIYNAGALAIIIAEPKPGRRMEYSSVWDTRDPQSVHPPLPIVNTSNEHHLILKKFSKLNKSAELRVDSKFYKAKTSNIVTIIEGESSNEEIIMCGHHDTVFDTPGGNDNASGAIGVIETAKTINNFFKHFDLKPKISLKFITLSAEEQRLQGSFFHVKNNYSNGNKPRFVINCDELSTGNMKGLVLGFPHLRNFIQEVLDSMNENFKVHVMSQIDGHSDHFPFIEKAIDACHPWRWRYDSRYESCEYHHESPDTFDKVNVKDLKYYISSISRLLIRLSMIEPNKWPKNNISISEVRKRLDIEKNYEIRTS